MSRKHKATPRVVLPDPVYQDLVVAKFVNGIMYGGKKSTAQTNYQGCLTHINLK